MREWRALQRQYQAQSQQLWQHIMAACGNVSNAKRTMQTDLQQVQQGVSVKLQEHARGLQKRVEELQRYVCVCVGKRCVGGECMVGEEGSAVGCACCGLCMAW